MCYLRGGPWCACFVPSGQNPHPPKKSSYRILRRTHDNFIAATHNTIVFFLNLNLSEEVVVVVPKMLLPNLAISGILDLQYLIRFTIRMLIVIFKSKTYNRKSSSWLKTYGCA